MEEPSVEFASANPLDGDLWPVCSAPIWDILEEEPFLGKVLDRARGHLLDQTLSGYLKGLLKRRKLTQAEVAENSGQDPGYISRLFNGKQENPSRDILLAIAIGMGLTIEETQRALRLAGHVELHPTIDRDLVILYSIRHRMDVWETDRSLAGSGHATLLSGDG